MLSDRLRQTQSEKGTCLLLPWNIDSVVSIQGSLKTSPSFERGDDLLQDFVAGMLDKGTQKRSKIELSTILENCGASIQFSSTEQHIRFSAKCLKQDVNTVLQLINEQLASPAYDENEFKLLKNRFLAQIQRQHSDTGTQSSQLLSRKMFSLDHPSFSVGTEELLRKVEEVTLEQIQEYGTRSIGCSDLAVVAVGDVSQLNETDVLNMVCGNMPSLMLENQLYERLESAPELNREHIEIADRNNLDVRIGHNLNVYKRSEDYLALFAATFMLGGNFSSHLMSTIRDRDGLTYGIRSRLSDVGLNFPGSWVTSVTLSQESVDRGIDATVEEIKTFVESPTPVETLNICKSTLTGSYTVRLSTTSGVASTILSNHENEFPVHRLDTYTDEVNSITTSEVDQAVADHLDPDRLLIVTAGTQK